MAFRTFAARALVSFSFCFFSFVPAFAQSVELNRYAVFFADKNNNPFSIYNPTAFLSPRAVERRAKQNIPVVENDLPVSPNYLNGLVQAGASIYNVSKWLNCAVVDIVDPKTLAEIESLPFVTEVRFVARYKTKNPVAAAPSKSTFQFRYPNQSLNTEPSYGMALRQIELLNGIGLHRKGHNGRGVIIAVFEAGFYNAYAHPGLRPVFTSDRLLATRDFVSNTTVFTSSSHGTQCLSVIGNNEPGVMVGTAPGATFVLCRTEESGSEMPVEEFNWAAAAEYADSIGADVISSSLGYTTFDDSTLNHTYEQLDGNTAPATIAADHAAAKGILVVNSAGNNGDKEWFYISAPADADSILAVGAVDENELAGLFSSNGFTVDGRVKPDVMAQGVKVVVANTGSLDYNTGSGTSFAAPGLAGMAACLVQAHPTRSAQDIINAIRRSADRFHQPDPKYGYGIPDMQLADLLLANVNINDFTSNPAPMVYPNPFRSSIAVVHYSEVREDARVELVDMFGRLLYTGYYILQPGYNQLVTDTAQMPAGMYVIRFVTESKSHELKAVHQ